MVEMDPLKLNYRTSVPLTFRTYIPDKCFFQPFAGFFGCADCLRWKIPWRGTRVPELKKTYTTNRLKSMSDIAVIIVNYNAAELAVAAIQSVMDRDHTGHNVEVHVVDNASPDDSASQLAAAHQTHKWGARVTLYPETTNHGFGRGNNVVLEKLAKRDTPPDYIYLLNPDAQLKNETLAIGATFLADHPHVGVLGCRAYNPGDPAPVTAAFRFPGLISTFTHALNFGPVSRAFKSHEVALGADLETQRVDWISGAGVMARFDVLQEAGFFDREYFLYYEEVDLILQCARRGWECWHLAEAEIIHIEGALTDVRSADNNRPRRPAYLYHSWQYYFRKNHGRAKALACAFAWIIGATLNHGLSRIRGQQPRAAQKFYSDFYRAAVRPLLGLSAKPPV